MSQQQQRLLARGILAPPRKKRPALTSWPEPPGNLSDEVIPDDIVEQVRREERENR